jgi:hypothetical protein
LHERLATPTDAPGAVTLYDAGPNEHTTFIKHLTAERCVEQFVPAKGMLMKVWKRERRANHYFDAAYAACAAGSICGFRLQPEDTAGTAPAAKTTPPKFTIPTGEPFLVTERSR